MYIRYLHFDSIDSTNSWVKKNAQGLERDAITCVTALEQTAGRARAGRSWLSPAKQGLYATLFLTLDRQCPYLGNLGQLLALCACHLLKDLGFAPEIKWPNDLLLGKKKVGGILCELFSLNGEYGVALGIGLNINTSEEILERIDQPATSLAQLSGRSWSLEQLLTPLIERFAEDLAVLLKNGFQPFHKDFLRFLASQGKSITFRHDGELIVGVLESVTVEGRLMLRQEDGSHLVLSAGEIQTKN